MTHPWIGDATVLWGLASAGLLDAARGLFPAGLHVTPALREELLRNLSDRPFLADAVAAIDDGRLPTLELTPVELKLVFKLRSLWGCSPRDRNNFGEAEVIALTVERSGGAILDDRRARMTISLRHRDRPLLDTPELLLNLVDSGHCTGEQAWEHLERMHKLGGFNHPMSKHRRFEYLGGRFYVPRTLI